MASAAGHSALQVFSSSGKRGGHGGERDREIGAVAGADADGAEGAGLRPEIGARQAFGLLLLLPNRLSRKLPGPRAALAYCGPQLFCASAVSTERRWLSRSAPPIPPLRRRSRLVVIWSRLPRICWIWLLTGPHCADWPLNSEKKPELSQPMRLACSVTRSSSPCCLVGGVLIAADLLVLGRIAVPPPRSMVANCASSRGHIGLIGAPCACGGGAAPGCICANGIRALSVAAMPSSTAQAKIHRERGSSQRFRHIRPLRTIPRGIEAEGAARRRANPS